MTNERVWFTLGWMACRLRACELVSENERAGEIIAERISDDLDDILIKEEEEAYDKWMEEGQQR